MPRGYMHTYIRLGISTASGSNSSLSATISAGDIAGTRTPRGSDGGQALPRSGSLSSIGSQSSFGSGFSSLTGLDAGGCCDVDVDAPDSRGRTALYAAVYGNHFRMMRLLLKLGADPNRPSMSIGNNTPRAKSEKSNPTLPRHSPVMVNIRFLGRW